MRVAFLLLISPLAVAAPGTYYVDQSHPRADDRNPGTDDAPFKTLGRAARAIKGGDTVIVMPGIYRETVSFSASGTPERPTVIRASENYKVIVTGADIVTDWERNAPLVTRQAEVFEAPDDQEKGKEADGELGDAGTDIPQLSKEHAETVRKQKSYDKGITSLWVKKNLRYRVFSQYPPHHFEQVVLDGRPLSQVFRKEEMTPGTFFCGENDLFLWPPLVPETGEGFAPDNWWEDINQGHTVEVSRREGTLHARGDFIHVQGFIFRYGCNQAQHSLAGGGGRGVVFEDCIAEYSGGTGIGLSGEGVVLRRVIARYNGNKGASTGFCWNGLWEDVELAYNNTKGFSAMWECGGAKCCGQRDCVFRRVHAHHNYAPGIWLDIDNRDSVFEDCWANDNQGPGFVAEISQGITWRNCVSVRNPSGIDVWESFGCTIEHCTLVNNGTGIAIRGGSLGGARGLTGWPRRDADVVVPYQVRDLVVRNNILAYNGSAIHCANQPDDLKILDFNLYWPRWGQTAAVCWVGGLTTLEELRTAGFEVHGCLGPPVFVDQDREDFRLQPESPAGGLCRLLPDVPKDKDGKPRDTAAASAGAYELPAAQRGKSTVSEAEALKMLAVWERPSISSAAGLKLEHGGGLRLLWGEQTLLVSDDLSLHGAVPRPGRGQKIWQAGAHRGPGQCFITPIMSSGKPSGLVWTSDDPEVILAKRQVTLEGNAAKAWYRVSVPPGCAYRPNLFQFSLALPGEVYAGVPFRLLDPQGGALEGKSLAQEAVGDRRFSQFHFDLAGGKVRLASQMPLAIAWNKGTRQFHLSFSVAVESNKGADLTWTLEITVEPAR